MEEITFENVLSEFNNCMEKQNNYIPSYFKEFLDFLKNDIERMSKVLINKYFELHIFFKYNYMQNGIFNVKQYQDDIQNILKDYTTDNYNICNDGYEAIEEMKNYFNTQQKAVHHGINFQNKKTKNVMYFSFILMDSCSDKIENIFCIFHEYCHVLQNYFFLSTNSPKTKNEKLYIKETQADVFGYCATIIKLLQINNIDLIKHVLIDSTTNDSVEHGYFSFPIIKDIIYNLNKGEFLKKFVNENNNIKYDVLYRFTLEKVRQKLNEYNNNINNSKILDNEMEESYKFFREADTKLTDYYFVKRFLFQTIRISYSYKCISLDFIESTFAKIKQKNLLRNYKSVEENIENFIKQEKEKVLE